MVVIVFSWAHGLQYLIIFNLTFFDMLIGSTYWQDSTYSWIF